MKPTRASHQWKIGVNRECVTTIKTHIISQRTHPHNIPLSILTATTVVAPCFTIFCPSALTTFPKAPSPRDLPRASMSRCISHSVSSGNSYSEIMWCEPEDDVPIWLCDFCFSIFTTGISCKQNINKGTVYVKTQQVDRNNVFYVRVSMHHNLIYIKNQRDATWQYGYE